MFPGILFPALPIFSIPFFAVSAGPVNPDRNPEILPAAVWINPAEVVPSFPIAPILPFVSSILGLSSLPKIPANVLTGPPITVRMACTAGELTRSMIFSITFWIADFTASNRTITGWNTSSNFLRAVSSAAVIVSIISWNVLVIGARISFTLLTTSVNAFPIAAVTSLTLETNSSNFVFAVRIASVILSTMVVRSPSNAVAALVLNVSNACPISDTLSDTVFLIPSHPAFIFDTMASLFDTSVLIISQKPSIFSITNLIAPNNISRKNTAIGWFATLPNQSTSDVNPSINRLIASIRIPIRPPSALNATFKTVSTTLPTTSRIFPKASDMEIPPVIFSNSSFISPNRSPNAALSFSTCGERDDVILPNADFTPSNRSTA